MLILTISNFHSEAKIYKTNKNTYWCSLETGRILETIDELHSLKECMQWIKGSEWIKDHM